MKPVAILLAASLAISPTPGSAQTGERAPDGGYLLVDTVLDGIEAGHIVPVFTHVALEGDEMRFTFLSYYIPSSADCEQFGKCHDAVQALTLRFEERDGILHVISHEILEAPDATIDRPDVDMPHIILPMRAFVDVARVHWQPHGFTLIHGDQRGRRSSIEGRFVAASLDFSRAAVAFSGIFELSLREVGDCILQQITTMNLRAERSPAEEELLATARVTERVRRLNAEAAYYEYGSTPDPRDPEEVRDLRDRASILHIALVPIRPPEELTAQLEELVSSMPGFAEIYADVIAGHEDEIIAARRYTTRANAVLRDVPYEEQAARVCTSILFGE